MANNLFDELAAIPEYGPKGANMLRAILSDPRFQGMIFVPDPDVDSEAVQGAQTILAFFQSVVGQKARGPDPETKKGQGQGQGKTKDKDTAPLVTPPTINDLPSALRQVFFGIADVVQFPSTAPTGKVPKEDGLPESCIELADTKTAEPEKMMLCKVDPLKLTDAADRIDLVRGFLKPVSRFTLGLNRARTETEISAYTMLSNSYGPFRTSAQADDDLADRLTNVEEYLYGSAQQGAKTNKGNQKQKQKMQTAADSKAMAGARTQINQGVVSELQGLMQDLQNSVSPSASPPAPATTPTDPASPSSASRSRRR
jgi:hypothetical protein